MSDYKVGVATAKTFGDFLQQFPEAAEIAGMGVRVAAMPLTVPTINLGEYRGGDFQAPKAKAGRKM